MDKSSVVVQPSSADSWVPDPEDLDALERKLAFEALADWSAEEIPLSRSASRSSISSNRSGNSDECSVSSLAGKLKVTQDSIYASQKSLALVIDQIKIDNKSNYNDVLNLWTEVRKLDKKMDHVAGVVKQLETDLMWINAEQKRKFDQIAFCTAVCNKMVKGEALDPNKLKKPKNTPVSTNPGCTGKISDWV